MPASAVWFLPSTLAPRSLSSSALSFGTTASLPRPNTRQILSMVLLAVSPHAPIHGLLEPPYTRLRGPLSTGPSRGYTPALISARAPFTPSVRPFHFPRTCDAGSSPAREFGQRGRP